MSLDDLKALAANANVQAALHVIRGGETSQEDSAYKELYGGGSFDSFADHPRQRITSHGITSTAAGAYQFLEHTWDNLVKQYGFTDFSPPNQDLGAVALIAGRKAADLIVAGHLKEMLDKCSYEWASLPPFRYSKQGGRYTLEKCQAVYEQFGGTYATQSPAPVEERSEPVLPIVGAILPQLISAAPDLIRIFGSKDNPVVERNAAVAEKVAKMAVDVTGAVNEQDAVQKLQDSPELSQKFRDSVAANMDQWVGMVTRLAELDDKSRDKARAFVQAYDREAVIGRLTFIEFLSIFMLTCSVVGATLMVLFANLSDEMKGAIVTMILIGGYNGVKEFWLGSSYGSIIKTPKPPPQ